MFKAIATDIDGTITDSNEKLNPQAILKIREIESKNIPVILISGHNLCSLETLSEYIGTSGPLVAENGCLVSMKRWEDPIQLGLRENTINSYELLRNSLGEKVTLKPTNRYRKVDLSLFRTFDVNEANSLLKKNKMKAFVMDSGFAIHIIDSDVNKGVGLRKATESMGIDLNEIIGIGDGGNDYHFLKEVGFKIVIGHAPESIKKIADYITKNSYGEGFVEAVNYIIGKILK